MFSRFNVASIQTPCCKLPLLAGQCNVEDMNMAITKVGAMKAPSLASERWRSQLRFLGWHLPNSSTLLHSGHRFLPARVSLIQPP